MIYILIVFFWFENETPIRVGEFTSKKYCEQAAKKLLIRNRIEIGSYVCLEKK